jgi:hypothetical protein
VVEVRGWSGRLLGVRGRAASAVIAGAIAGGCGGGSQSSITPSTSTSASQSPSQAVHAGKLIRKISGAGPQTVGSLSTKRVVVLTWTATKPPIQIFTSKGFLLVKGDARSGQVELTAGSYPGVRVATAGRWMIELHLPG